MHTSAGIARTPYLATVSARVCACRQAPKELGTFRTLDKARKVIEGYWAVYIGFFGDQMMWLDWSIVDRRDGKLIWRNGRQLMEEEHHGESQGTGRGGHYRPDGRA